MMNLLDVELIPINPNVEGQNARQTLGLSSLGETFAQHLERAQEEAEAAGTTDLLPLVQTPADATLSAIPSALPLVEEFEYLNPSTVDPKASAPGTQSPPDTSDVENIARYLLREAVRNQLQGASVPESTPVAASSPISPSASQNGIAQLISVVDSPETTPVQVSPNLAITDATTAVSTVSIPKNPVAVENDGIPSTTFVDLVDGQTTKSQPPAETAPRPNVSPGTLPNQVQSTLSQPGLSDTFTPPHGPAIEQGEAAARTQPTQPAVTVATVPEPLRAQHTPTTSASPLLDTTLTDPNAAIESPTKLSTSAFAAGTSAETRLQRAKPTSRNARQSAPASQSESTSTVSTSRQGVAHAVGSENTAQPISNTARVEEAPTEPTPPSEAVNSEDTEPSAARRSVLETPGRALRATPRSKPILQEGATAFEPATSFEPDSHPAIPGMPTDRADVRTDAPSAAAPTASSTRTQLLLDEAAARWRRWDSERRLDLKLHTEDGQPVRLTIQPNGRGQHRIAFMAAHAHMRDELRRNLPQIRDAVAKFPIDIADISFEAEDMNRDERSRSE